MKNRVTFILGIVSAAVMLHTSAQTMPTKQPPLLHILREKVKTGRSEEHAKHEAGWVAAYEKAKYPFTYVAVSSMTGPSEVWYIAPAQSHEEMAKGFEAEEKNPLLAAELAALARGDAEFIESAEALHAAARPELSFGDFPDMSKVRFYEITILKVRPGHETEVEKAGKAYAEARKKAGVKGSYRIYSVIAGMPNPTYLILGSVEKFGDFDRGLPDHLATMKELSTESQAQIQKAWADGVLLDETNRYRVEPKQSYVAKEVRDRDPEFWGGK